MPLIVKGFGAVRQDHGHAKPWLKRGGATALVRGDDDEWVVIATDCQQIQFMTQPVIPAK